MQHTIITITIEMDDNTDIVYAAQVAKYAAMNIISSQTKCVNTTISSFEMEDEKESF